MDDFSVSNGGCDNIEKGVLHAVQSDIDMSDTSSSNITSPLWSSESDISCEALNFNDQLEGIFYRTHVSESKLNISFVSNVFFETFKNKIHADYMNSVDIDATSFISRCTTHVHGAKCDIKLDSHFKTVELSGIDFKKWREERFPKIAQSLFKQIMQNLDSLVEEPSEGGSGLEESPDQSLQHRNQICEKTTTGSQNDVNINIAPNIDAAQSDVMQLNVALSCTNEFRSTANNDGLEEVVEFERESLHVPAQTTARSDILYTAEKVTDSYKRSVNVASSIRVNLTPTLDKTIKIQPTPALTQGLHDQVQSNTPMPTFTSTPILQRQNSIMADNNVTSGSISLIMNRIEQLDLGIKAIKRDVIRHMESQMNQLKSSVISMMENLDSNCTYAKAVIRSSSTPRIEQPTMDSCYIDEGYEDQSQNGIQRSSSQTRPKTIFVADSRENMNLENKCRSNIMTSSQEVPVIPTSRIPVATTQHVPVLSSPQPVPVRVTNRNMPNQQQPLISQTNNSSTSQKKTLLIGDSILKGINYRGLKNGVKICARSGALINDLWDEISVYDMKSFRQIIVCVGGNDCASGVDLHDFEKKYDQLIRIIKSANSDCIVYLSKIVPRGDVDVSAFNASIMRIVDYWALQQVKCIEGSYDLFFNRNGMHFNMYEREK